MFHKRRKDFLRVLHGIMNTEEGQVFLKYLDEDYVKVSAVQQTVELTYYRLGQKELVQSLLNDAGLTEKDLEKIQTTIEDEVYYNE